MTGGLLFWLALLAVLGLWMLGAHNRVTALKAAVLAAWQPVDAALQSRGEVLAVLLAGAAEPLADEAAATDAVAAAQAQLQLAADAVRRAPLAHEAVAELARADAVLVAVLDRLVTRVEQCPAQPADADMAATLSELREQQQRLAFARQLFNEAGQAYDAATGQFPTRLLASALRFGRAGRL